jgi:hypothetical protein
MTEVDRPPFYCRACHSELEKNEPCLGWDCPEFRVRNPYARVTPEVGPPITGRRYELP